MNTVEPQDAGRTVTRRRHIIVARKRPATLEHTPLDTEPTSTASVTAPPTVVSDTRIMTSEQLFAGQNAVAIRHNGALYTLRVTRFGKLILTK
ncbi:hemin uptake protein HemP (plasmid) [Ralstonia syzygii subsp. celebesensis]|uniref:Hemin uptake protein HemP n=3 Tax=Ralstonia solanacearum species complex TaxID=3116862 RepID=A0AAD0S668_RALSL|nr:MULTISPECIES: hemin uptake protein HemP [Ralstonia solanacearum species complex]CCA83354.1 putative hemin uptake protein (hemP) [blood disease bacterium R229]AMP37290.1 hemin transporter [Ralstonia solanacearum]AQW32386.1 hemin transporter [blood disease bacterium A2-HR MARDI]AXV81271.1 hemin uptake protein HemP [Ralstonia solanacearum]AXV86110.1 hemin uptake protein HemP [Ralstonia solanacearum]